MFGVQGSATHAVASLLLSGVLVTGMMDYRHFATSDVRTVGFADPGVPPPSMIYALNQMRPPYDISEPTMEPFPGCDSRFAAVCAVQHSIRMVTRAKTELCPKLAGGAADYAAALSAINSGTIVAEGASGFGLVAFLDNGTIIADGLRPDLVGKRIDGILASGYIAQASFLPYVEYLIRWTGGFVPHFTTRLKSATNNVMGGEAPDEAAMYVEACPTGERLGVSFGRTPIPAVQLCSAESNAFCAVQNVRRIVGMTLVDVLTSPYWEQHAMIHSRITYSDHYTVKDFYMYMYQLSNWGWPGQDPHYNLGPLEDTLSTNLAHNTLKHAITGRNLTFLPGTVEGIPRGDWLLVMINSAAWIGGAWRTYMWNTPALGDHLKLSLTVGFEWNGTAYMLGAGVVHAPSQPAKAANCATCDTESATVCAAVNTMRLVSHAVAEILTPGGVWSTITNDEWFGAMHANRPSVQDKAGTWPMGFYVFAYDYNGTCVADGKVDGNVGMQASATIGSSIHTAFMSIADNGGGWREFQLADGVKRLAYVTKSAKWGRFFYAAVAFKKEMAPWEADCTSAYSEPCSANNAEALVGIANADIIAAETEADVGVVLQSISGRSGSYASQVVGDFRVNVYDEHWNCPTQISGGACPRAIPTTWQASLQAASDVEAGRWTFLPATDKDSAMNAFVYRATWSPPTTAAVSKVFMLVVFVDAAPGPLRCTANGNECPANSGCSQSGRCLCNAGFRTNFTTDTATCGDLKPASMTCVDVRGVDCTRTNGAKTCPPCAAGFFCPGGSPLPCPRGQFCPAGSEAPSLCPSGTFGNAAQASSAAECTQCSPGLFTGNGGQTACEECPAGRFSTEVGTTQCTPCDSAEYQPSLGSTACLPCEAVVSGSRSQVKGSDNPADCVCPEGSFLDRGSSVCETCREGMECATGSDLRHFSAATGASGPVPQLQPGYWSSPTDPLNVFSCRSNWNCPGGEPGTCGAQLEGIACATCASDFFWDGEKCSQCGASDVSPMVFPILPILIGFLIPIIQYYILSAPYERWGSMTATAGYLLFVLLNHYQIISIIGSTNVNMPSQMETTYSTWSFTNDFSSIFKTACNGLTNLRDVMLLKALSPTALAAVTVIDFFIARFVVNVILTKVFHYTNFQSLDANKLFNAYGSVIFTFFGAIAAMSMDLWKCMANPNGKRTMFSDASVICFDSDQWKGMLGISIVAVLVYVFGAGALMVRCIVRAHALFNNITFRTRWKFIFEKYRLGCWWFGLAFLAKNFLVNLALVIFPVPSLQFFFIALVIGIYLAMVMCLWPYRTHGANRLEMLGSASICLNCMFMSSFTFSSETDASEKNAIASLATVVTYSPLFVGGIWIIYLKTVGVMEDRNIAGLGQRRLARVQAIQAKAVEVQNSFAVLASMPVEDLNTLYGQTGEYEHWLMQHAHCILMSEFVGVKNIAKQKNALSLSLSKSQPSTGSLSHVTGSKAEDPAIVVI